MTSQPAGPPSRTTRSAWTALALLTATNVLMSLDRTIPQLIAEPVKIEFGLTDAQLGAFIGIAFGLSYGVAGLVIGPLVDRHNRRSLLALILSVWSGMTFLTGMATSYLWLLVTRAGLGAAEAGGNPAALSIIGDLFPPEKRSSAIGIYKIGVPLGIFLASALVGLLATDFGWRTVFFVAGVPGFIVAILIWRGVAEPKRGAQEGVPGGAYQPVPYLTAVRFVLSDRRVMPLTIGLFVSVFAGAAIYAFLASFLQRIHGVSLDQVGLIVGVGAGISALSPVVIGLLGDKVSRGGSRLLLYYLAALNGLAGSAAVFLLTQDGLWLVVGGILAWQFFSMGLTTPGMAALITLTPAGMRGTIIAFISVGNMLLGFGLGPFVVGLVSDAIGTADSLQLSLIIVSGAGYVISTLAFLSSGLPHREREA